MAMPTVPISPSGLEGWTSCCDAAVTFSGDGALCCKACWNEVQPIDVGDEAGEALDRLVRRVIEDGYDPDKAVEDQKRILAGYFT